MKMKNELLKPGDIIQVYIPQSSDDDAYRLRYNKLFGQKEDAKFLVVRVKHSYDTGGDFTTTMKVTKGEYGAFPSTELSEVNGL